MVLKFIQYIGDVLGVSQIQRVQEGFVQPDGFPGTGIEGEAELLAQL